MARARQHKKIMKFFPIFCQSGAGRPFIEVPFAIKCGEIVPNVFICLYHQRRHLDISIVRDRLIWNKELKE